MKLTEHRGKELLRKYGIETPAFELVEKHTKTCLLATPFVLKSQVLSGDRMQKGGVVFVERGEDFERQKELLFQVPIDGAFPETLLAEEKITGATELYLAFSCDADSRTPVVSSAPRGGSGV
ncbi:MAG: hypothetical protein HYW98_01450, partial [Candidatus Wildermuthbacteria bacterium]|nr:hypothetical protein [Candidatus Wildermuthbacteria bacterium]